MPLACISTPYPLPAAATDTFRLRCSASVPNLDSFFCTPEAISKHFSVS